MKIDLKILFSLKKINLDEEVIIPEEYYKNTDIIRISNLKVNGSIFINLEDDIELNVLIKGTFILPCAISLEEVPYDFETYINEIIPENSEKSNFTLELLDILWENTVLEVPIRVIKEGVNPKNVLGSGWQLDTEDESS